MNEITKKQIGQRINTLLAKQDKKQKELAEALKVKDNTISYFVSGARVPNLEQIVEIAKFFKVSSDYLLGLIDSPSADIKEGKICDYTGLEPKVVQELNSSADLIKNLADENKLLDDGLSDLLDRTKFKIDFINYLLVDRQGYGYSIISRIYNYIKELEESNQAAKTALENWQLADSKFTDTYYLNPCLNGSERVLRDLDYCEKNKFNDTLAVLGNAWESQERQQKARYHFFEMVETFKGSVSDFCAELERENNDLLKKIQEKGDEATSRIVEKIEAGELKKGDLKAGEPNGDNS